MNKKLCILESLSLDILLVPYIALRYAGQYHMVALFFGLAITAVYTWLIFYYLNAFRIRDVGNATTGYGIMDNIFEKNPRVSYFLGIVYIVRYLIRAGFIVFLSAYVLDHIKASRGASFWWVAVSFAVISVYGAGGDFKKRCTLAKVLYYWILVPLILTLVLSISRISYGEIARMFSEFEVGYEYVFEGSLMILAVMGNFELLLFSMGRKRAKKEMPNFYTEFLRIISWIFIAVVIAYLYVIGMVGRDYISFASFDNMSFGLTIDYAIVMSLVVGTFFQSSSYVFYAREFLGQIIEKENEYGDEKGKMTWLTRLLSLSFLVMVVCLLDFDVTRPHILRYLICGDVFLGAITPGAILLLDKVRGRQYD